MKFYTVSIFVLFFWACSSQPTVKYSDLLATDSIYYLLKTQQPFTGRCIDSFPAGGVRFDFQLKNGMLHGESKLFYENGKLCEQCTYQNGKRQGTMRGWCDCGPLLYEINYTDGIPNGPTYRYADDGKMVIEQNFVMGMPQGKFIEWYLNGNKKVEQNYALGKLEGESYYWNEQGKLMRTEYYKNDSLTRAINN